MSGSIGGTRLLTLVWFGGGRTGLILIDTPQLYTRERLVNDRFREAAWLEQRLAETDTLIAQDRFRQPDFVLSAIRELKLQGSKIEAAAQDGRSGPAPIPAPNLQDLQPSPQDEFEDVVRYREAIRESLMAMQLDDRHDIAGNTIYRLNFRATIIPEPGARKVAVITVTLRENANDPENPNDPKDPIYSTSYFDLLYDWRDELQRQIVDLVDDKTNTLLQGSSLITAEQRRLNDYIDNRLENYGIEDFSNDLYMPILQKRKEAFDSSVLQLFGIKQSRDSEVSQKVLAGYRDRCSLKLKESGSPEVLLNVEEIKTITGGKTNNSDRAVQCRVFGLNEFLLRWMQHTYLNF
jgi:hypothetical protein